jgi:hypothetical protein
MYRSNHAEPVPVIQSDRSCQEEAAEWIMQQAGDLGISDDVLTKYSMIDAYCTKSGEGS